MAISSRSWNDNEKGTPELPARRFELCDGHFWNYRRSLSSAVFLKLGSVVGFPLGFSSDIEKHLGSFGMCTSKLAAPTSFPVCGTCLESQRVHGRKGLLEEPSRQTPCKSWREHRVRGCGTGDSDHLAQMFLNVIDWKGEIGIVLHNDGDIAVTE